MVHWPIHATGLFLNLTFSYKWNFNFDGQVLEGRLTCIQRMIPDYDTRNAVNREIEVYRDGTRVFSFGDDIHDRADFMLGKLLEPFKFSPLFERWIMIYLYLFPILVFQSSM